MVVVLKDGEISEVGSYDELVTKGGAFSELVNQFLSSQEEEANKGEERECQD